MQQPGLVIPSASGVKHFFPPSLSKSSPLHIRGIGIREVMPPGLLDRPTGTEDYLLMLFHDPIVAGCSRSSEPLRAPDTMMIWSPRKPQYYGNPSQRFCHSWIHCSGSRVRQMLHRSGIPLLRPFAVRHPSNFQQCLLDMHSELISYASPSFTLLGNLLENSLVELSRAQHGELARIPENLLAVKRLISTAPGKAITLDQLAASAGMSVPYFCSRFREVFGLPPMRYLAQHRMHHAAHLLSNKNFSIGEIAAQVGYEDVFHFSKMFKNHFGVSPRTMRNRASPRTN